MKKKLGNLDFLTVLGIFLSCIASAQTTPVVPAKTASLQISFSPKKIYEWSQPYNSSERLLVTVAVYDVSKFATLIREKDKNGKIVAYRYAAFPGDDGTKSVSHEIEIPVKGFPQSFLSRLDAGYHINVPQSIADQIGNDFKEVLGQIKDMLKGPQNEIDKLHNTLGKGSDPFAGMNTVGDGNGLPFGHTAKQPKGGAMGPTPFEIASGKSSGYASEDVTTSVTTSSGNITVTAETTIHDDGTEDNKLTVTTTNSDGSTVSTSHLETSDGQVSDRTVYTGPTTDPDKNKTVIWGRNVDNHGNGSSYEFYNHNDGRGNQAVYQHKIVNGTEIPTESSEHRFTSAEINQMFQNHMGWFAEEFCFRKKKEPADFLNPTRSPVADGAGGNVNVNHLGKDAVVNPNENKLKNINPNSGSDSASKINKIHVDPPNTRNKSKGN